MACARAATRPIGHHDIRLSSEVKLRLIEENPTARTSVALAERSAQLGAELRRRTRMRHGRTGLRVQDATDNFGHQVPRRREHVRIRRAAFRRVAHGPTLPRDLPDPDLETSTPTTPITPTATQTSTQVHAGGGRLGALGGPSSTSRTLRRSVLGVIGFCRNAMPESSTPWCTTEFSV